MKAKDLAEYLVDIDDEREVLIVLECEDEEVEDLADGSVFDIESTGFDQALDAEVIRVSPR